MVHPERIGRYRIECLLGEGGMGVVYRAVADNGALVALKVLRAALAGGELLPRFRREARIRIDHVNVVRVVDAGADAQGTPFIAFELLDGETLADRLTRGTLGPAEVVRIGVQACRGLAAAHGAKLIHRDLKPSNIFLCRDDTVKLLDFGIALLDTGETRLTRTGAVPGTVGYLSPEQASGGAVLDARSDLWSLGAVLYECLAGAPPFRRESPLATVVATLMAELPPLSGRNAAVPAGLAATVERALSRDARERFPDASAFGAALDEADLSPPATPDARARAPGSIRPGERRVIAVLLAEGVRDPIAVEQAVAEGGGAALRVAGERVVGLFGGERWEGDEVDRAAEVAVAIRPMADRVSVSSGWATQTGDGIAGAGLREAERCCAAGLRGVAVDTEAARTLRDSWPMVSVAEGLWELLPDRVPTAPGLAGPPTVGRDAELAQLSAALRTTLADGSALAVLVTGPLGVGKSRLRTELALLARAEELPMRWIEAAAASRHADSALSLVRTLVLGALPTPEACRESLERLAMEAVPDRRRARACAEALADLVGLGVDEATTGTDDVGRASDRVRLAALEWLEGLARRGPLVIALDDLQWADDASLDLFEELLERTADAPLLLFAAGRPELLERRPGLFGGHDPVRISPRHLSRADVSALASAVAARPVPDAVVRAVHGRTQGNPFFVIQIVRALSEEGRLEEETGEVPLPVTVEAAVQSRLDHLEPAERELCRHASVWGRPFTVEDCAALGAGDAARCVAALIGRDLLAPRGVRSRGELVFRSSLVSDIAYRSLAEDLKRTLHGRAAAHLETGANPDAEALATHREKAGQFAEAARAYATAARRAVRRGDSPTALSCSERAIALAPDSDHRHALHMLRIDALRFLGRREEQGSELEAALTHAVTEAEIARALSERAVWRWRAGRAREAAADADAAVEAARRSGEAEAMVLALGRQFLVLAQTERADEATAALDGALERSREVDRSLRAMAMAWRAHRAATSGDLGEHLDAFGALAELYDELGDLRRAAGARANLADAYNRLGAYADAAEALREAAGDCRRVGHRTMEGYALLNLGYSLTGMGTPEEALPVLDAAAVVAAHTEEPRLLRLCALYRARALLAAGDLEAAGSEAAAAASAAGESSPDIRVGALVVTARTSMARGDAQAACASSTEAMRQRDELGGVEEDEAELFLVHAEALRATGRPDEADRVLARGRDRLREIARGIPDMTLRDRFLDGAPAHRALLATEPG